MCDPRDLGVALSEHIAEGLTVFEPNLYLYDNYPGGIGQSAPLFRLTRTLLEKHGLLIAMPLRSRLPELCRAGRRNRRTR